MRRSTFAASGGCLLALALVMSQALGASVPGQAVQARLDADTAKGLPIVIHLVVALCDNVNQGIVPTTTTLGDGQTPRTNLYWGALYGVKTHLSRSAGWTKLTAPPPKDPRILERVVFFDTLKRGEGSAPVYIVADAWDGAKIKDAMGAHLAMAAGLNPERVTVSQGETSVDLNAGGGAHLVAYVGHNGLMEVTLNTPIPPEESPGPRSAIVLACASKAYFVDHFTLMGTHPLVLTTGLMAPEAYTLDAALRSWVNRGATPEVLEAAAGAYNRYQKCGLKGARRLFWGAP